MVKNYFILLIICSCFICCNKKTEKEIEADYIQSFISKVPVPEGAKWLVILPGMGCHGCIQEGEAFIKENIRKKNLYFILTSVQSLKVLQHKTGVAFREEANVYIDRDDAFVLPTNNNIYPCIVHLDSKGYADHEFQNPKNGQAFTKLEARLAALD